MSRNSAGATVPPACDVLFDGVDRTFADLTAVEIDARHSRLGRERDELRTGCEQVPSAKSVFLLCKDDD